MRASSLAAFLAIAACSSEEPTPETVFGPGPYFATLVDEETGLTVTFAVPECEVQFDLNFRTISLHGARGEDVVDCLLDYTRVEDGYIIPSGTCLMCTGESCATGELQGGSADLAATQLSVSLAGNWELPSGARGSFTATWVGQSR